ncbi:MAG: polyprenol phosphomannose-dependent alpha 1,6 mannosyltransferase MptB, partial [Salegentibacter sp.]
LIQLEKHNFKFLLISAVLLRLIFLFALPNLSQDFYRFIWDGRLIAEGFNPYLNLPASFEGNIPQANELIKGMGALSAGNFTNYPPVNQLVFALTALLTGKNILGSVIVMRLVIIAADLGTLYFGGKLLKKLDLPSHRIFWYILNPFIIIELTGNLHFEGVMIFFLVWAICLLHEKKWIGSAILLGISISVKLLPLMLLPLFLQYFRKPSFDKLRMTKFDKLRMTKFDKLRMTASKEPPDLSRGGSNRLGSITRKEINLQKLLLYYLLVGITVLVSFLPFFSSEFFSNFFQSMGLWFQKFEFNASIYYIIRWIGFQTTGYNIIGIAGKILPVITVILLAGLAVFRRNDSTGKLIASMLLGISAYFFLSTTVHPWYIATPLILSIFTKYRFALVWSFAVFFSYYAYANAGFQENLWLIALEYLLVLGVFFLEISGKIESKDPAKAFDFSRISGSNK